MKKCVNCQEELEDDAIFCDECQERQPEVVEKTETDDSSDNKAESVQAFSEYEQEINSDISQQLVNQNEPLLKSSMNEISIDDIDENIISDCNHFKLEINNSTKTFLADTMSNIQFRISPINQDSHKADRFSIYLKYPGEEQWQKNKLRIRRLSFPRTVYINFKPKNEVFGNGVAEIHFSYRLEGNLYCFEQQIELDIHDNTEGISKSIAKGGININMGDIHQEGKAGDPSLNLFNGLYQNEKSAYQRFSSLKRKSGWEVLQLFQAVPLETENKSAKKLNIPLAPSGKIDKIKLQIGAMTILLFNGTITCGRSRETDLLLRNEPKDGETWDLPKMQSMNLSINKVHCRFGIADDKVFIEDSDSTNGTYINDVCLEKGGKFEFEYLKNYDVSLAPPFIYPKNIQLDVKVYPSNFKVLEPENKETVPAGIVIHQDRKENFSAVIINRWVPISAFLPEGENLFLAYNNGHFAVTDGSARWDWLLPGLSVKPSDKILIKVDRI